MRIRDVRRALAGAKPERLPAAPRGRAAVAVVLREAPELELLFIERARRTDDPWSGHMAFPGGWMDPEDTGPRAAAERETLEEVGLSLSEGVLLGQLDDLQGRHAGRPAGVVISAYVYHLPEPGPLRPNYEVETAFWFPFAELGAPERHVPWRHPAVPGVRYPGILVGEPERHVVWGLTYRFLEGLLAALGRPLPDRWQEVRASDHLSQSRRT